MIKVAFGSVPKDGGTFTFYRNSRPALLERGIDLRCVAVGAEQRDLWEEAYADDGCVLLAPRVRSVYRQSRRFADWCEAEGIDIVMGINSEAILSAIPHLPERVRVMSRCANAFDHGYRITMSGRDRLMRIVALSPRLRDDLTADYGADPERIQLIPNGIDPAPFEAAAARPRGEAEVLRLGFLGRLEHGQKGVMHLPEIVRALKRDGTPFELRIAGKGRDAARLEKAMAEVAGPGEVTFLGALEPERIPGFLAETDVFLFTSRFEGIPNALLEALMAGCVPVSFVIDGITDFVIDDGVTGHLCPQGDHEGFARHVAALAADRAGLQRMHAAAARAARDRFTNQIAADRYAALFRDLMAEAPLPVAPKPWSAFRVDPNFEITWRRYLPRGLRVAARRSIDMFRPAEAVGK